MHQLLTTLIDCLLYGMRLFMRFLLIICLSSQAILGLYNSAHAQTEFDLWAERVNWDGITPWRFFLNIAPASLGPNALPVLHLQRGLIRDQAEIELRPEYHFNEGDHTYDIFLRSYLPLATDRVALEVFMVTFERYHFSDAIRDERNARVENGEGQTVGDVFISTIIQVLKDKGQFPDLALSIQLKTASGGSVEDARYTDAPAYAFDISAGKSLPFFNSSSTSIRLYGMLGFYVWQIYHLSHRQNDAIAYGTGATLSFPKWELTNDFSGYAGYTGNGDIPLIYRIDVTRKQKKLDWRVGYQVGIHDFPYQTIRLSMIYHFDFWK